MTGSSKILTVSYGTFSCTLEGFDNPFSTMRSIAEYFRDLAADDRYFGAEPPTPDAAMLARIAEQSQQGRIEARVNDDGVVLRQMEPGEPDLIEDNQKQAVEAPAPPQPQVAQVAAAIQPRSAQAAPAPGSVADKLSRIRAVVARSGSDIGGYVDEDHHYVQAAPANAANAPAAAIVVAEPAAPAQTALPKSDLAPAEVASAKVAPADGASAGVDRAAEHDDDLTDVTEDTSVEAASVAVEAYDEDLEPALTDAETGEPGQDDDLTGRIAALRAANDDGDEASADQAEVPVETADELATATAPIKPTTADVDDQVLASLVAESNAPSQPIAASDDTLNDDDTPEDAAEASEIVDTTDEPPAAESEDDALRESIRATVGGSGLSDEDEDDLTEKLAAAARGHDESGADDVTPAGPEGEPETQQIEGAEIADIEPADAATPSQPAAEQGDVAVDRILEKTNSELNEHEGSRRRSAIAHLKAAVAATRADGGRIAEKEVAEDDAMNKYRDDLAHAVRPQRPTPRTSGERDERPSMSTGAAPLMLVSSLRVDDAEGGDMAPAATVRPRRVANGDLAFEAEDDAVSTPETGSFAAFAAEQGARELPELMEAAAAYATHVEGRPHVTRPLVMNRVLAQSDGVKREDALRAFGRLLRDGRIIKLKRGQFAVAEDTRFRASGNG